MASKDAGVFYRFLQLLGYHSTVFGRIFGRPSSRPQYIYIRRPEDSQLFYSPMEECPVVLPTCVQDGENSGTKSTWSTGWDAILHSTLLCITAIQS